jgi:CRISPR-associated protein Cas2
LRLSRQQSADGRDTLAAVFATRAGRRLCSHQRLETMETRSLYLAAYDVADPRRLKRALDLVKGYSTGGQKSVHECFLTAGERGKLIRDVARVLVEADDSFLLLRLDPRARVLTLGKAIEPLDAPYFHVS